MKIGDTTWLKYEFDTRDQFMDLADQIEVFEWEVTADGYLEGKYICDIIWFNNVDPDPKLNDYITNPPADDYLFHLNNWEWVGD